MLLLTNFPSPKMSNSNVSLDQQGRAVKAEITPEENQRGRYTQSRKYEHANRVDKHTKMKVTEYECIC